jgi:hypothetical protein
VTGRRGRRRKRLRHDLEATRGYCKLNADSTILHCVGELALEEAVDQS